MNEKKSMKRKMLLAGLVLFACAGILRTPAQEGTGDMAADGRWEYMALAGPTTTNFAPSGNPRMKKDSTGGFAREAFVLEQHLDKLGAQGWELVAIAGPPTDPAYYFKRRK